MTIFLYKYVFTFVILFGLMFGIILNPYKLISVNASALQEISFGVSNDVSWQNDNLGAPSNASIIAGPWVLDGWQSQNTEWLQKFKQSQNQNKTPYIYSYIIAGKARADFGIQDCNVSSTNNLCQKGSNYLRNNYQSISQSYSEMATEIKNIIGVDKKVMIHLEPDFYQYGDTRNNQEGGALSPQEAHSIMNSWTSSIKNILPNSILVLDISPWNLDLKGWSDGFNNFDYAGMVGKRFGPNGDGSVPAGIDGKTYKQMSLDTGLNLILNDAHGPGGYFMNYNYEWDNDDLIASRSLDGVSAVLMPPNDQVNLSNIISRTGMIIIQSTNPTILNFKIQLQGALIGSNNSYLPQMRSLVSSNNTDIPDSFVDTLDVDILDSNKNIVQSLNLYVDRSGNLFSMSNLSKDIDGLFEEGTHYFNFKHRNHIGVGVEKNILEGQKNTIDLTIQDISLNQNQIKLPNNTYALKFGDANSDGVINAIDRNLIGSKSTQLYVYSDSDINLDGIINSIDRNLSLQTPSTFESLY